MFILTSPELVNNLFPFSQAVLWRYKFSQLKGSSDDGKTRVKLLFKNAESNQIEMKVKKICLNPSNLC